MAVFNPQWFTNPVASLNTAFGVPTCMLNFTFQVLSLFDSTALSTMYSAAVQGRTAARKAIADFTNDIFGAFGILQYDAGTGKLSLFGAGSKFGFDFSFLDKIAAVAGAIDVVQDLIEQGEDFVDGVNSCLAQFNDWQNATGPQTLAGVGGVGGTDGYADNYATAAVAAARQQTEDATAFIENCNRLILDIGSILDERQRQEEVEDIDTSPIFRLVYGPPISRNGIFVLSENGLYYDSQTRRYEHGGDIPNQEDIGVVLDDTKWNLDHAPNLGGKGQVYTMSDLDKYVGTIFDINLIDNSKVLTDYYQTDHFLQVLVDTKDTKVFDLSSQYNDLIVSGYNPESAMVVNYKQNIYAAIDSYNKKINKRKKQIEVAVKAPDLFGSDTRFDLGTIPVNDFSYLSSINLDVGMERQTNLVFQQGEINDVVLPLRPKFVRSTGVGSQVLLSPLVVPPVGKGGLLIGDDVAGTRAPALSLTDHIESTGLFAVYNFLRPSVVSPGSTEYTSINCASLSTSSSAQLVGNTSQVFVSGLGIPFFQGIVKRGIQNQLFAIKDVGGYGRLPSTPEFQNLLYNPMGCSLDFWVHIPRYGKRTNPAEQGLGFIQPNSNKGSWADYNYYRIILGNENTGGSYGPGVQNLNTQHAESGTETVKGLLIGFSRDPVIVNKAHALPGPNTDPGENYNIDTEDTAGSSCFFIAPTMSVNTTGVEFIPKGDCFTAGYHKMVVADNYSVSGKQFTDVSSSFIHVHIAVDVPEDECRIYLDGYEIATSSVAETFGSEPQQPPRIPTFIKQKDDTTSSFYYSSGTVTQVNSAAFNSGPNNDAYFTPWIVGGGWTDGIDIDHSTSGGGFMGNNHGWTSGLRGQVGSLKFYSRPLTTSEVVKNYTAQKDFFKNIKT